jgi:hypothetical protein
VQAHERCGPDLHPTDLKLRNVAPNPDLRRVGDDEGSLVRTGRLSERCVDIHDDSLNGGNEPQFASAP